jgi:hypothetical protein
MGRRGANPQPPKPTPKGEGDLLEDFVVKEKDLTKIQGINPVGPKRPTSTRNRVGKTLCHKGQVFAGSGKMPKDSDRKIRCVNTTFSEKSIDSWPNMGDAYSGCFRDRPKAPPDPFKESIKKYLKDKRNKLNPTGLHAISDVITGEAFLSSWFYRDLTPYVGVSGGWIRIIRPIPFDLIPLVLQQLCYIPSTVKLKRLVKTIENSSVNWTPVKTYNLA